MMVVYPVQQAGMQVAAGGDREGFQEVGKEGGRYPAHLGHGPLDLDYTVGAAGEVHNNLSQGFVHGHERRAYPGDILSIAKGLLECLA